VLKLAVGGAGDTATLPDRGGDHTTSMAGYFADGRFLLQGDLVDQIFDLGYAYLNKKLVGELDSLSSVLNVFWM